MVISFEEKDRAVIESNGRTIIEFKHFLHQIGNVYQKLVYGARCIIKAWKVFKSRFYKVVDNLKLLFEEIRELYHYPTSFRYKSVKLLSKCTGIEKREIWKMTQHIWLARSCC